mgnify:CR=1 FL=1
MSELAEALSGLDALISALPQRRVLPPEAVRATHKMMVAITNGRDTPPVVPQPDRLDQVWRELCEASRAGEDLALLPPRTLRDSIWLLWDRRRSVVDLPGLMEVLLDRSKVHSGFLRRLVEVWLRDFDPALQGITSVGRHVAKVLLTSDVGPFDRWRATHEAYQLFDAAVGPKGLARALQARSSVPVLAETRLDAPMRATGGFMRSVAKAFGSGLPAHLRAEASIAALDGATSFYAPGGKLRFDEPAARGEMANALVGAWVGGAGPDALRDDVLQFLRQHLGDPRVSPSRWAQADEKTLATVRGWLAKLTLDAFFDIIGQFAARSGFDPTWQQRKAFWSACLRKGWISDGWLALGPNVSRSAAVSRELRGSFGRLDGAADKNHSVLLIRIGQTVFAEWSHNGRLRAWEADSTFAPRFFGTGKYLAHPLRVGTLDFPRPDNRPDLSLIGRDGLTHFPDVWQGRVAALLRRRENLRLSPHEWMA